MHKLPNEIPHLQWKFHLPNEVPNISWDRDIVVMVRAR